MRPLPKWPAANLKKVLGAMAKDRCTSSAERRFGKCLPPEVPGKFAAVQGALAKMPRGTAAVYIGDDETDEGVFAVLKNQITVQVGLPNGTHARYFLPAPADVLRFLSHLEREFRS